MGRIVTNPAPPCGGLALVRDPLSARLVSRLTWQD